MLMKAYFDRNIFDRIRRLKDDSDSSGSLSTLRKAVDDRKLVVLLGSIVLDETVLWRNVGGPEVMHEQLLHINEVGGLPNVTIQVAPLVSSSHPADKSFRILEYSERTLPDIVLLEQLTSPLYLEDAAQVDPYRRVMSQLMGHALTADETTSFIRRILAEPTRSAP